MKKYLLFLVYYLGFFTAYSQKINEFHYAGTQENGSGFVEVLVPVSFTEEDKANTTLTLYGDRVEDEFNMAESYYDVALDEFTPGEQYEGWQVLYIDIPAGLADPAGAISLSYDDAVKGVTLYDFISYGGEVVANDGPAFGETSTDIGITEDEADGAGNSVYLPEVSPEWFNLEGGTNSKGARNGRLPDPQPVQLLSFLGKHTAKGVVLTWTTAMEVNNDYFVVERGHGESFSPVGQIKGNGNTLQEQQYQFIDKQPISGTTFYRLKQVDFDGTTSYFKIIAINTKETDKLLVYPNPTTDNVLVAFKSETGGTIQIFNKTGQIVYRKELGNNITNAASLQLDNLPSGTYFLILERGKERQSKAIIKL